jgi:hypothetical protein
LPRDTLPQTIIEWGCEIDAKQFQPSDKLEDGTSDIATPVWWLYEPIRCQNISRKRNHPATYT